VRNRVNAGTVDRVEASRIKLKKRDSSDVRSRSLFP
jgi:hypothetical protein